MCGYMSDYEYRQARRIEAAAYEARRLREQKAEAERQNQLRLDRQRADEEMRQAIAARIEHELDHSAAGKRSTTERVKTRALA